MKLPKIFTRSATATAPAPKPAYEIAFNGSIDNVRQEVARLELLYKNWRTEFQAKKAIRHLGDGARQAFKEGRPNIAQAMMAEPAIRCISLSEVVRARGNLSPAEAVTLALKNTSDQDKAILLGDLLNDVILGMNAKNGIRIVPYDKTEEFMSFILQNAGVSPQADMASLLAQAVAEAAPQPIIQQLTDHGASKGTTAPKPAATAQTRGPV